MSPVFLGLGLALAASAGALPPITSLPQALGQLAAPGPEGRIAALENVAAACRGRYRRDLTDQRALLERAQVLQAEGPLGVKRAVLDLGRCFSAPQYLALLGPALTSPDPEEVAYAAEAAARFEDPGFAGVLLDALDARRDRCLGAGLTKVEVEACVWVTYAPGAVLGGAGEPVRRRAAELGARMFAAPYPKVREVAVETVTASGIPSFAAELARLITDERDAKRFAERNPPELLRRFEERRRTLAKGR